MPADVDVGEAILAVNGCADLVQKAPVRITQQELFRIDRFPETIDKMARQLCRDRLERPYERVFVKSYKRTLDLLSEPPSPDYLASIAARFPPAAHGAIASFMVVAARAWNFLAESYPKTVKQEMLGVRNLAVGGPRLGEWESIYTAVNDPLHLFDLVRTARLQKRQVEAVQLVYPTTFIAIKEAIFMCAIETKARRPKWEPPFVQGIATLIGVPGISPDVMAAVQQAAQETRALNEQRESKEQAARTAAVRTAPNSQRQDMTEAKEAQL